MDIREMKVGRELEEELTKLWKVCETKEFAVIFEKYMKDMGVKRWDGRRKDNRNTYLLDGRGTGWNRVTCYYYKDNINYGNENLSIVLRKRAGSYLIVAKGGERAFEVDYRGTLHYEGDLLKEIMEEHKVLFDALLAVEGKA